jgi:nicotinamide mononucleotide transporter
MSINDYFYWIISHKIELIGTILGLIYVWFSIRQSIYTWHFGILTSLIYCWIFLVTKLYAQSALQVYYVVISIYGWWNWSHKTLLANEQEKLKVSWSSRFLLVRLFLASIILIFLIHYITSIYTDDFFPLVDALIASLSITATWMLTQKKIEHWLIWIFIDIISIVLYLNREMYPTAFLFLGYTIMAGIGYYEWRKEFRKII